MKNRRRPPSDPKMHYNPIFPGGRPQDRSDNQAARVSKGDKHVLESVKAHANAFGDAGPGKEMIRLGNHLVSSKKYR
jgi:hypothetical protein